MLSQFFDLNLENAVTVKEGDVLSLGRHQLHFTMAPMVHWPEVMFTYDSYDKVLFSADAFGKFGALDAKEDWLCEARRWYYVKKKYKLNVDFLSNQWNPIPPFSAIMSSKSSNSVTISSRNS